MKIEFDVKEEDLRKMAEDRIREQLGPKKINVWLIATIEGQIAEVIKGQDFRPLLRKCIDDAVGEIAKDAVQNRLRGIIKAMLNQEIEKAIASSTVPAQVRT